MWYNSRNMMQEGAEIMFTSMHYYALRIVSYLFLVVLLIRKISNIKSYKDLIFVLIYILICQLSMYLLKIKEKKLVHHVLFFDRQYFRTFDYFNFISNHWCHCLFLSLYYHVRYHFIL